MTAQEYKNKTITDLFNNRYNRSKQNTGIGVKIEGMLYRSGLMREAREYLEDDVISETFLQLAKTYDDETFYSKFFDNPNQLNATTILIAGNIGVRNSSKPIDGVRRPKGCLRDEMFFASSYKSGRYSLNYDSSVKDSNGDNDSPGAETLSEKLVDLPPDILDKNELFELFREHLTVEEADLLDQITNHKMPSGRKKADLQRQVDVIKGKIRELITRKEWSVGEKASKYKNANYKYLDEEAA